MDRMARKLRLEHYDPRRVDLPKKLVQQIKVRRLGRTSGYTAWIVDGAVIRAEVDIDFAIGGNPARYAYIPENEIWLEWTGDEDDVKATFMHEVMEADIMRRGYGYDQAHEWASEGELAIRALGEGRGLPHFAPNPAEDEHPDVARWRAWVESSSVNIERRKLIVQVIAASMLTYRWVSYETALQGMKFLLPSDPSVYAPAAAAFCRRHDWKRGDVKRAWESGTDSMSAPVR
jgi:hypothetical protein